MKNLNKKLFYKKILSRKIFIYLISLFLVFSSINLNINYLKNESNYLINAETVGLFSSESTRKHLAKYIHVYTEFNAENDIFRKIRIFFKNEDISALTEQSIKKFFTNYVPENGKIEITNDEQIGGKSFVISFNANSLDQLEQYTRNVIWDDKYTILFQDNEKGQKEYQENYNLDYLLGEKSSVSTFDQKIVFPENTKINVIDVSERAKVQNEADKRVSINLPGKDNIAALFELEMPFKFSKMEITTYFDDNEVVTRQIRFITDVNGYDAATKVLDPLYSQLNIHSYQIVDENNNPYAIEYEFSSKNPNEFFEKNKLFFKDNVGAFAFRKKNFFKYYFDYKESFFASNLPYSLADEISYRVYSKKSSTVNILDASETESSQFKGLLSKSDFNIKINKNDYQENLGNELFISSVRFKRYLLNKLILPIFLLFIILAIIFFIIIFVKSRKLKNASSLDTRLLFSNTLKDKNAPIQRNMNSSIPGLSCWQLNTLDGKISHYSIKKNEDGTVDYNDLEQAFKWIKESVKLMNIQRYLFYSFPNPINLENTHIDYLQVGIYQNKSIDAQYQLQMRVDDEIIALTFEKRFALKKDKEILSILEYAVENDSLPDYCSEWNVHRNDEKNYFNNQNEESKNEDFSKLDGDFYKKSDENNFLAEYFDEQDN